MDVMIYHGKRIAVVIRRASGQQVFHCTAAFEHDEELGPILRIPLKYREEALQGGPAFILKGNESSECLIEDEQYGCDFRIEVGVENNSNHAMRAVM